MKFLCDQMLGNLSRWLRFFGFDTYYIQSDIDDDDLLKIASTAMNSKAVSGQRDQLAKMVVEAVKAIYEEGKEGESGSADLDRINIIQKQGKSLSDTELIKGVVIDSATKKSMEYATIAVFSMREKKVVTGTVTNSRGFFNPAKPGLLATSLTLPTHS